METGPVVQYYSPAAGSAVRHGSGPDLFGTMSEIFTLSSEHCPCAAVEWEGTRSKRRALLGSLRPSENSNGKNA